MSTPIPYNEKPSRQNRRQKRTWQRKKRGAMQEARR